VSKIFRFSGETSRGLLLGSEAVAGAERGTVAVHVRELSRAAVNQAGIELDAIEAEAGERVAHAAANAVDRERIGEVEVAIDKSETAATEHIRGEVADAALQDHVAGELVHAAAAHAIAAVVSLKANRAEVVAAARAERARELLGIDAVAEASVERAVPAGRVRRDGSGSNESRGRACGSEGPRRKRA
jgi:hypothetical protein